MVNTQITAIAEKIYSALENSGDICYLDTIKDVVDLLDGDAHNDFGEEMCRLLAEREPEYVKQVWGDPKDLEKKGKKLVADES